MAWFKRHTALVLDAFLSQFMLVVSWSTHLVISKDFQVEKSSILTETVWFERELIIK